MLGFLPVVKTRGGKSAVALSSEATVHVYVALSSWVRGDDTSVRMVSWSPRHTSLNADPAICIVPA